MLQNLVIFRRHAFVVQFGVPRIYKLSFLRYEKYRKQVFQILERNWSHYQSKIKSIVLRKILGSYKGSEIRARFLNRYVKVNINI